MVKVMLVIQTRKEAEVLSLALQQKGVKTIVSEPTYSNYLKSVQYAPDLIFIEIPPSYTEQLFFIHTLKKNKKTFKIPIIGYGNLTDSLIIKQLFMSGFSKYFHRPLKFAVIIDEMKLLLKGRFMTAPQTSDTVDQEKRKQDFAFIADKEKLPTERIEKMVDYVGKLLAFPFSIARILKISQDETSGANELTKAIKADASITATILKITNSVLFASRDRTISNIKEAVIRIGFRETKNIALSMSIMKLFGKEEKNAGYNRMEYWQHSLACGVVAEKLAKNIGFQNPEEIFIAGLLHDFGILLFDEFFGELFEKAIALTTQKSIPLLEAEKELFGLTHNDLVEKLFEKWSLPRHITFAVSKHEEFLGLSVNDPLLKTVATLLGISNIIAKAADLGMGCDQVVHHIPKDYFLLLKMPGGPKPAFFEDIYLSLKLYGQFLNIESNDIKDQATLEAETATALNLMNYSDLNFEPHLFYLRQQGYRLIEAKKVDDFRKMVEPSGLVLLNTTAENTVDDISPFLSLLGERKMQEGQKPIPLLLFCDSNQVVPGIEGYNPIRKIPKRIDLRNVVAEIEKHLLPVSNALPVS